jgi:hypothetical protein
MNLGHRQRATGNSATATLFDSTRCAMRYALSVFGALLFALCVPVQAQQTGKIFRIGFLDPSSASGMAVLLEAFREES